MNSHLIFVSDEVLYSSHYPLPQYDVCSIIYFNGMYSSCAVYRITYTMNTILTFTIRLLSFLFFFCKTCASLDYFSQKTLNYVCLWRLEDDFYKYSSLTGANERLTFSGINSKLCYSLTFLPRQAKSIKVCFIIKGIQVWKSSSIVV